MRNGLLNNVLQNIAPCAPLIRVARISHDGFLSVSVRPMGGMLNILLYLLLDT